MAVEELIKLNGFRYIPLRCGRTESEAIPVGNRNLRWTVQAFIGYYQILVRQIADNFYLGEHWKCGLLEGAGTNILACNTNLTKLDDNLYLLLYVLLIKVFKSMLLICKTVRAIRNFSIVFRNILIGVCMAALDPMFHLKNLQLEEVYSLYARRKGFHWRAFDHVISGQSCD